MFKKHLESSGKSYWHHLGFAFFAGLLLIYAGITSIIHAFIPALFPFTSLNIVKKLVEKSNS